jgi:hypothetical protein
MPGQKSIYETFLTISLLLLASLLADVHVASRILADAGAHAAIASLLLHPSPATARHNASKNKCFLSSRCNKERNFVK